MAGLCKKRYRDKGSFLTTEKAVNPREVYMGSAGFTTLFFVPHATKIDSFLMNLFLFANLSMMDRQEKEFHE